MLQMANYKSKVVEHYYLQNLFYTTPLAQFWTASHKILKKSFTLKKIKACPQPTQPQSPRTKDKRVPLNLNTNLNFTAERDKDRRNSKMSETNQNYCESLPRLQLFPGNTSFDLFKANQSQCERSHLFDIFISAGNKVLFGDWTLARNNKTSISPSLLTLYPPMPQYGLDGFKSTSQVDIYKLGIVFDQVISDNLDILSPSNVVKLQRMMSQMMTANQLQVLKLESVIKMLKTIMKQLNQEDLQTPTFSPNSKGNNNQARSQITKSTSQENIRIVDSRTSNSSRFSVNRELTRIRTAENGLQYNKTSKSIKRLTTSRITGSNPEIQIIGKRCLGSRSLISFLLSLSLYFVDTDRELSIMILHFVKRQFRTLEEDFQDLKKHSVALTTKISITTKSQWNKVTSLVHSIQSNRDKLGLRCQYSKLGDQNQLNCRIKEVVQDQLCRALSHLSYEAKTEHFFKMYLLTRSIEYGNFHNFWKSVYNYELTPERQNFLTKDRNLGMRYFRKKTESTLAKLP